jgi:hypothetical protein
MLKDYSGFLQADGYAAYEHKEIGGKSSIILHYCHTHTRRKFVDSRDYDRETAEYYISQISLIYVVEREIKDLGLTGQDKVAYREKHAGPVLDALGIWLEERKDKFLPKSPIGKAINYALKRWEGLKTYLHHAFLEPDTNLLEQEIRRNTLGRNNWLFAGSAHGGRRIALIYSLIAGCQEYNIDPYVYFEDILSRINLSTTKESQLKELLPNRWQPRSTTIKVGAAIVRPAVPIQE